MKPEINRNHSFECWANPPTYSCWDRAGGFYQHSGGRIRSRHGAAQNGLSDRQIHFWEFQSVHFRQEVFIWLSKMEEKRDHEHEHENEHGHEDPKLAERFDKLARKQAVGSKKNILELFSMVGGGANEVSSVIKQQVDEEGRIKGKKEKRKRSPDECCS